MIRFARWSAPVRLVAPLAVLAAPPALLGSQETSSDAKKFGAYLALSTTPVGALPPLVTRSMAGGPSATGTGTAGRASSPQIAFRYGRGTFGDGVDETHLNAYAATGMLAAGEAATISGTIGLLDPDCNDPDCDSEWMFSLGSDVALGGTQLGAEAGSPRLTIGLSGELGFAKLSGDQSLSLTAGMPVALVARSGTMRIVPFLTPALGYGRLDPEGSGDTFGAVRFLLGGGVSLLNIASALSVNVGFQKIFFSLDDGFGSTFGSKMLFGA